jgi:hypothetical protein
MKDAYIQLDKTKSKKHKNKKPFFSGAEILKDGN